MACFECKVPCKSRYLESCQFDESFDETSDEGKKMLRNAELNEVAYTERILSIHVKSSEGKVAFNFVKGCKTKEYPDGNAATTWERLMNKFEPVSAPSMVKLEKQFRALSLKKGEDPEVWITELEDLLMRLEDLGSTVSDNQFMIHVLNNLTLDYDLQLALMEKRVGDMDRPLSIEEIKAELILHFERLNVSSKDSNESSVMEEHAVFIGKFKGYSSFGCKEVYPNYEKNNGMGDENWW
jgi:gag-polypeptide of LTR copia-type